MSVQRYTPMYAETATDRYCHMLPSPTGGFVLASDYEALRAERDEAVKLLHRDSVMRDVIDAFLAKVKP